MKDTIRPIDFVERILADHPSISEVFMSVYRRHPHTLIDDRDNYFVPLEKLREKYEALLCKLAKDEEIAFNSLVKTGGAYSHLLLVDFRSPDRSLVQQTAEDFIDEYAVKRAALFESCRSFHLYLNKLVTQELWVKFMGRLLLVNDRVGPVLTDARWVGHRLIGGYGALRWSANTPRYAEFGTPRLVRQW
jgi:hypothetical protein